MKKIIASLLTLTMVLALLAGCGSAGAETPAAASVSEDTTEAVSEASEPEPVEQVADVMEDYVPEEESALPEDYPMIAPDGMTVSVFATTNPMLTDLIDTMNDLPWWQEVTARTGIGFDWRTASFDSAEEKFNLLVAASDLPNLVGSANYYKEGITSAVENDVFVDLNPYLDAYAPDYRVISLQDGVRQTVYDGNGSITTFYEVGMEEFAPNNGVLLRGDLLEEQGLEAPITYDEYEDTLLKLKEAYDIANPIYLYPDNTNWLAAGKDVKMGFSVNDAGEAIYGPVEDGYREYLKIANKWFEEGLIYRDFYAIPDGQNVGYLISQMSSGDSIATFAYCEFAASIALDDGEYLVPGYEPRNNRDDQVHLAEGIDSILKTSVAYALSTNNSEEEIQDLCMLMNYFYTEEGSLFANYGVEGQGFTYRDDGTPWYTDLILNNPDGMTMTQSLVFYVGYMVPAYADYTKYNIASLTTWKDFVDVWDTADNTHAMPQVVLTTEETEAYAKAASDVETYLDEMLIKFIIGDADVNSDDDWNAYIANLESLGVNDMIDIYRTALTRYNNA